jgi:signal transduction histidine kinase
MLPRSRLAVLLCAALLPMVIVFGALVYTLVALSLPASSVDTLVRSSLRIALLVAGAATLLLAVLPAWLLAGLIVVPFRAERAQLSDTLETQRRLTVDAIYTLRTPLASIRTSLELLGRVSGVSPAEQRAAVAAGTGEADRALRMLDALFVLARADTGEQRLPRASVALAPLVGEVVRQAHLRAPERSMTVNIPADIGALGDADAIRQILSCLVANALEHTPPEAVIGVRGMRVGDRVALVVADTGPGIPPEEQGRVFERFTRGTSASGSGPGLGLAIASTLAEGMGGAITLTSAEGAGSVFTLRLPGATVEPG